MNLSRASSSGIALAILLVAGCGSSGSTTTPTGGAAGTAATGGGGGTSAMGSGGGAGGAVTATKATLLVDFDDSDNNVDPTDTSAVPSASDTMFAGLLQGEGVRYDTFVVPEAGTPSTPATSVLAGYSTLVWYTGEQSGQNQTLSAAQEATVEAWLDQGQKTMLVFSQQLFFGLGVDDWTTPEKNVFLSNYIGAAGDAVDNLADVTYTAKGAAGTAFAGQVVQVISDTPIGSTADEVNPKSGTDTLVTVSDDPDGSGTKHDVAVVVGRKHVGAAGTSTVVYVGMPIENLQMTAKNSTSAQFFQSVLVYAGLKSP